MTALLLVGAACGSESAPNATTAAAPATTAAPTTTAPPSTTSAEVGAATTAAPTTTQAVATTSTAAESGDDQPAHAEAFPVTIQHKYGETVVGAPPERVITVGFSEQDAVLALGVIPVAIREWFGGYPHAVWPWGQDELGDGTPEVLTMTYGDLNYELLASLAPDLLIATHAGITEEEYALLSAIAPTLPEPAQYPAFGVPWHHQTVLIGTALGLGEEAEALVAETVTAVEETRERHDGFGGATFAWANPTGDGTYWVVGANTPPMRLLQDLGLTYPDHIAEVVGDLDSYELSGERIELLDVDVLIMRASPDLQSTLEGDPLWSALEVMAEQRVLWLDSSDPVYGALSFTTILSIEYLLQELVPLVIAKLYPEEAAAMSAWSIVFDSNAEWTLKAPHIEDSENLKESNEHYRAGGEDMGGFSLMPTDAIITGDSATITYDVLFGETPAYTDIEGVIELVDGIWVVSRDTFCGFLDQARTPCG
jgi:iron complex transport system substrate-binding protein